MSKERSPPQVGGLLFYHACGILCVLNLSRLSRIPVQSREKAVRTTHRTHNYFCRLSSQTISAILTRECDRDFPTSTRLPLKGTKGWTVMSDLFQCLDAIPEYRRAALQDALIAEWTCASAGLEGNTFSLGDTDFFLRERLTVAGKTFREHYEIKGHAFSYFCRPRTGQ